MPAECGRPRPQRCPILQAAFSSSRAFGRKVIAAPGDGRTPSPIRLLVILQEFPSDMFTGVNADDDRVHAARRAVHEQFATREYILNTHQSGVMCVSNETNQHRHG